MSDLDLIMVCRTPHNSKVYKIWWDMDTRYVYYEDEDNPGNRLRYMDSKANSEEEAKKLGPIMLEAAGL